MLQDDIHQYWGLIEHASLMCDKIEQCSSRLVAFFKRNNCPEGGKLQVKGNVSIIFCRKWMSECGN